MPNKIYRIVCDKCGPICELYYRDRLEAEVSAGELSCPLVQEKDCNWKIVEIFDEVEEED